MNFSTAENVAIDLPFRQANVSQTRKKAFPTISHLPLSDLSGYDKFIRFSVSPISPKAFPQRRGSDWHSHPTRAALLERYLDEVVNTQTQGEAHHRDKVAQKTTLTLARAGIADALSTPDALANLWACLAQVPVQGEISGPTASIGYGNARKMAPLRGFGNARMSKTELKNSTPRSKLQKSDAKSVPIAEVHHKPTQKQSLTPEIVVKTPLPEPFTQMFAGQLRNSGLFSGPSIFDPPAAPTKLCFPGDFPASPKMSRPAPIDTTLTVSKHKKWTVIDPASPAAREVNMPKVPLVRSTPPVLRPSPLIGLRGTPPANALPATNASVSSLTDTLEPTRLSQDLSPQNTGGSSTWSSSLPSITENKAVRFTPNLSSPTHGTLNSPTYWGHMDQVALPSTAASSPVTPATDFYGFSCLNGLGVSMRSPGQVQLQGTENFQDQDPTSMILHGNGKKRTFVYAVPMLFEVVD